MTNNENPTVQSSPTITSLDFASAIAAVPKIRLYQPGTNTLDPSTPIPREPPLCPFAVPVTDFEGRFRTVAIDLDSSLGDPASDSARIREWLGQASIQFVETVSGPTGGRHLLFTLQDPASGAAVKALAAQLKKRTPSLDTSPMSSGRGACIRPPLAPHRVKGESRPTGDIAEALNILRVGNPAGALATLLHDLGIEGWVAEALTTEAPTTAELKMAVSDRMLPIVLGTMEKGWSDTSTSGVNFSILISLINAGFRWGQIAALRLPEAEGQHRSKGRDGTALSWLHEEYERALRFVKRSPAVSGPNDMRVELTYLANELAALPCKGRAKQSQQTVLQALLAIAIKVAKREVSASVRQLSESTRLSVPTVHAALTALLEDKALHRVFVGNGPIASTYRILGTPTYPCATSNIRHRWGGRENSVKVDAQRLRDTQHDAFLHHPGTARCYAALSSEPEAVRAIAEALACGTSNARRHLRKLECWGLASRDVDGRWSSTDRDLDEVARLRGTWGDIDEKRALHKVEREMYRRLRPRYTPQRFVVDEDTGEHLPVLSEPIKDPA